MLSVCKRLKARYTKLYLHKASQVKGKFERKYSKFFKLLNVNVIVQKYRKPKSSLKSKLVYLDLKVSMTMSIKILESSLVHRTVFLGYQCKYLNKEPLLNVFKFDVKPKQPLNYWIIREYTDFHQDEFNKAYFQHITPFQLTDTVAINLVLSSERGLLQIDSLRFKTLQHEETPHDSIIEDQHGEFDLSRVCEIESMKNIWGDLKLIDKGGNILRSIQSLFEPNFVVQRVLYSDIGYYLFKIYLVAFEKGCVRNNGDIGILIEVKGVDESVSNECKKNCLLFDSRNKLECRVGDIVLFYITKSKM